MKNVPENEQFENINLDGIFKNSSNDASAAEEVREDTPKDFDEEEIDNGQPTVPENYEEVELEIVNQENVTDEEDMEPLVQEVKNMNFDDDDQDDVEWNQNQNQNYPVIHQLK